MQMNIDYMDGSSTSVFSDGIRHSYEMIWKASGGPIIHNDIFGGETYDARLEIEGWTDPEFDDSGWKDAVVRYWSPGAGPDVEISSQLMPAIKVNKILKPVDFTSPETGVYVYDLGQVFGGWIRLRVKGPRGTELKIRYSGRPFGESYHTAGESETDTYILNGDPQGEVFEPRFTYHPVRYVRIEGYPGQLSIADLEGRVVYNDIDMSGDFTCSNPLFNQIHQNVTWTLSNTMFGIPLDCLHREHWAWLDPATVAGSVYPRKHMPLFWTKWLTDIKDAQLENGSVPDVAPNYHSTSWSSYPADPAWGSNYPILVWYIYQYYGDRRVLEGHYEGMKKWTDYLTSTAENHLITSGRYGDHMVPGDAPGEEIWISSEAPTGPLVWTGYYYRNASIVSRAAEILGITEDAGVYAELAGNIKNAFNEKWLDNKTSQYADGSQTQNIFPVELGIVPGEIEKEVVQHIISDITDNYNYHHHTGNTGTTCLIDALAEAGYADLLYRMVNSTDYPGWGYMVKQGSTTINESWGVTNGTDNMIMWAVIDEFFYNDLAGIKGPDYHGPGFMTPGFREIEIKPYVAGDLTYAWAAIRTVRGMLSSMWERSGDSLRMEIRIPVNSTARVSVPKMGMKNVTVIENHDIIWKKGSFVDTGKGISGGTESENYVTFNIGSGFYDFLIVDD